MVLPSPSPRPFRSPSALPFCADTFTQRLVAQTPLKDPSKYKLWDLLSASLPPFHLHSAAELSWDPKLRLLLPPTPPSSKYPFPYNEERDVQPQTSQPGC